MAFHNPQDEDYDLEAMIAEAEQHRDEPVQWAEAPLFRGDTLTPPAAIETPPRQGRGWVAAFRALDPDIQGMLRGVVPRRMIDMYEIYRYVNTLYRFRVLSQDIIESFDDLQPPSVFPNRDLYELSRFRLQQALSRIPPPPPEWLLRYPTNEIYQWYRQQLDMSPPPLAYDPDIPRIYHGQGGFMSALGSAVRGAANKVGAGVRAISRT